MATADPGFTLLEDQGTVTVPDCDPPDILPITGMYADDLLGVAILLLGGGLTLVFATRRREEN